MQGLSAIRAGLLGAAGGGALIAMLALSAPASPAQAAPSCVPTANGQSGSGSATPASGTQTCSGGDTGVAYKATGGDLTVNLNNDPITGHAINISDDGLGRTIIVNDGLASAGFTATAINANDFGNYAVKLSSTGGNVSFTTYAGGTVTYSGTGTSGSAIGLSTTGSGNVTITTGDAVSSSSDGGIAATAVNGAIVINAGGNVTANNGNAISGIASGTGSVTVNAGTATTPITVTTTNNLTLASIYTQTVSGAINLTAYGTLAPGVTGTQTGNGTNPINVTVNGNISRQRL